MMIVGIAIVTSLLAAYYGQQYWQLATDGVTAPALSVKVEQQHALGKVVVGDPYRYYADYTFADADGKVHGARRTISRDLYKRLSGPGSAALTVHYSRARPDVSTLDMRGTRWLPLLLAVIAGVAWIAAAVRLLRG